MTKPKKGRKLRDPVPVGSLLPGREFLTTRGRRGKVIRVGPGMAIVEVEREPKKFKTRTGEEVVIPKWDEGPWSLSTPVIPLGRG